MSGDITEYEKICSAFKRKKEKYSYGNIIGRTCEPFKGNQQKGRLFLCGPLVGSDKAIKIIYADSMNEAVKIAHSDPFTVNSYYPNIEVLELEEANEANEYLLKG